MHILEWIRYQTEFWSEEHKKLAFRIASELVWYRPQIRNKILKEVQKALNQAAAKELK